MKITARAPVRIDFAGAWTDVALFSDVHGGATLNAAINQYVFGERLSGKEYGDQHGGVSLAYHTDVPSGGGLGSSACMNVVWRSLIEGKQPGTLEERLALAEDAYQIEKVLGIIGGKQDQHAAALGGIHLFEFRENETRAIPLQLYPEFIHELESRLLLCYTGEARLSSNIHEHVWDNFKRGNTEVTEALLSMKDSAYRCKEILEREAIDEFGKILSLQFECAKVLDRSTSNQTIEKLYLLLDDEILGGKPCGAGGGGCVIFCCDGLAQKTIAAEKIQRAGFSVIDFRFDFEGLQVEESREEK